MLNIQAETPADRVMAVTLHARSAKTPAREKKLEEAYNPKLTEPQKRNATRNPYFKPDLKDLAPDHFITTVIK
jgi:hypothetical protein